MNVRSSPRIVGDHRVIFDFVIGISELRALSVRQNAAARAAARERAGTIFIDNYDG